jgi:hypothetical protein
VAQNILSKHRNDHDSHQVSTLIMASSMTKDYLDGDVWGSVPHGSRQRDQHCEHFVKEFVNSVPVYTSVPIYKEPLKKWSKDFKTKEEILQLHLLRTNMPGQFVLVREFGLQLVKAWT